MPNNNNKKVDNAPDKPQELSVSEIKAKYEGLEKTLELFSKAQKSLQLLDLTKTDTRNFTLFSKEKLRQFQKNPKANETNIRNLSRFLFRVSHPYRRIIEYYSGMIDLTCLSIIPSNYSLIKENSPDKVLKNYYNTCVEVEKINLAKEIYKGLVIAWREDTFYGYTYEDDTGFYLMPLDGDYCKVSSVNFDGTLNFAFDFSYFRNRQELLEFWDKEFKKKYSSYSDNNNLRWQELDPNRTMCLKINIDDPTMSIPKFFPLMESIIDLADLQSLQSVKDELSIYKLLVARLDTNKNSNEPDDFVVDPDTALDYYYKLSESLPESVACALSPLPIDPIEFKPTDTSDVDMIANSTSNLFNTSGGAIVLNQSKSGSTMYEAMIKSDETVALNPLLSQIEAWMNRYLTYVMGDHAKVKYMKVSPYTKKKAKEEALASSQNGLAEKLYACALDGFIPLETLALTYLENDCLKLHEKFIPLSTSYTMTGNDIGKKEKDVDDLTQEGQETREQEKNKM